MLNCRLVDESSRLLNVLCDGLVGIFHVLAGEVLNLRGKLSTGIYRANGSHALGDDALTAADSVIVLNDQNHA